MRTRILLTLILTLGMLFLITACASTAPPVCEDHPAWVEKGGGFFSGDRGAVIYGVGVANVGENTPMSMLRISSDARSRADIAQTVKSSMEVLTKIYAGTVTQNQKGTYEELIRNGLITFTQMDLVGAAIVDHHNCPRDKAYYALARMDPTAFGDTFKNMQDLSNEVKDIIEQNSSAVFDEMARRSSQIP